MTQILVKKRVGLRRLVAGDKSYALPLLTIFLSCPQGRPCDGDMGDTVHKACKPQVIDDQDLLRKSVQNVGVVVRRPSCKRHKHVQLALQQLSQPFFAPAIRGQGEEAPTAFEKRRQGFGRRVTLVYRLRQEIDIEVISGRQKL